MEIPLTESQREVWLVCQQSPTASSACNETWTLHLDGPLDAVALRESVQEIIGRHDALRSTFDASGETMKIAPALTLEIPLVDFSELPDEARESKFAALRRAESVRVFDLKHGPMLALQLVRLTPNCHAFVFNAHHLVCDGWSCDVFLNEFAAIYSARVEGRAHELSPAMQMCDFERRDSAMRVTSDFAVDSEFWLEKYRGVPPILELQTDRPYPAQRTYRGASEAIILAPELPQTLAKLGARNGATLFSVLLAAFKVLLFQRSGEADLAVGVPSAAQNFAGGEHLVGHCVNMLPLRSRLDGSQPFSDLLNAVQSAVMDAFEHRRVTFGWLLQRLVLPRVPGRVPLFR